MSVKRAHGVYYTERSPFDLPPFKAWARQARLSERRILEPFAGANNIIHMLRDAGLCKRSVSYDIDPTSKEVKTRDTIADFPSEFDACVTNPPWLARNSATRRGLPFPSDKYDDLYKHCLALCYENCDYIGALIPASYLQSGLFLDRLRVYILLHGILFDETENPVCLALFNKNRSKDVSIYHDDAYIGEMNELKAATPAIKNDHSMRFNDPDGDLGFVSFDNTKEPTIQFCEGHYVSDHKIKHSSRFITRISGDFGSARRLVPHLNKAIAEYRGETQDVFLTPFKGLRSDGHYRRRMEYALARVFINAH